MGVYYFGTQSILCGWCLCLSDDRIDWTGNWQSHSQAANVDNLIIRQSPAGWNGNRIGMITMF